jgi:hypothetical protein
MLYVQVLLWMPLGLYFLLIYFCNIYTATFPLKFCTNFLPKLFFSIAALELFCGIFRYLAIVAGLL